MEKPDEWKRIESVEIADQKVFKLRKDLSKNLKTNQKAEFYVIECPNWVNVIPLTKKGEVVLIEQFRHGVETTTLEIPGGMIDKNEEPLTAARRELLEETGYRAGKIISLGKSTPNPAIQNNQIYHFLAIDCENIGETGFDEYESIVTKLFHIDEIPKLIESEEITHSLVLAGFQKFENYKNRLNFNYEG